MKGSHQLLMGLTAAALCLSATMADAGGAAISSRHAATPQTADSATHAPNDPACSVHLWDGKNYTDRDIVIQGPGDFATLRDLAGANGKDWNDEADSLKVGSTATVKTWKKQGFKGASATYAAGGEHPKLKDEPSSLKITCK